MNAAEHLSLPHDVKSQVGSCDLCIVTFGIKSVCYPITIRAASGSSRVCISN